MTRFIIRRLGEALIVLAVMSFVVYGLINLMPGDPLDLMIASNPGWTAADITKLRAIYGLDQPMVVRYWHWLTAALQGDFGYSRVFTLPVTRVMGPALLQTTKLMGLAFLCTLLVSLGFGIAASLKPGSRLDRLINFIAFAGISLPVFWLALLLIFVFAVWLGWLPASGMGTIGGGGGFFDSLKYLVLPVITLSLSQIGNLTRFTRASMIETMRMDYIRTARAKGAGPARVVWRHALRNALIPVVTVLALNFGSLFSGALITETMFGQRGMGKMIYDAVLGNDFNLALIGLLFASLLTLVATILADIAYAVLDPRISLS
ncbi:MAG TPA: ABC transporter permease [Stellaceae bacterium]|nr:ABC transporter permease [Stellaceae bacterium]